MSPAPRLRTLADQEVAAIATPPAARRPAGTVNESNNSESASSYMATKAASRRGARSSTNRDGSNTTMWVDKTLWGQAKTLYARSLAERDASLGEWLGEIVIDYLTAPRARAIPVIAPIEGSTISVWLATTVKEAIAQAITSHAAEGRAMSRSNVVVAALQAAVTQAGGADVPVYTGRLPRGRRPNSTKGAAS